MQSRVFAGQIQRNGQRACALEFQGGPRDYEISMAGVRMWCALTILARGTLCCAQLAGQAASPLALYNELIRRLPSDRSQGTCREAEAVANRYPEFYGIYNLLGLCAMRRGDTSSAVAFFRRSVALNPDFLDARNNLGVQLIQQGQAPEAEAQFRKVLAAKPADATALFNLGSIEASAGRPAGIAHLRRAAELMPGDDQILIALGRALIGAHQLREALAVGRAIIEKSGDARTTVAGALIAYEAGDPVIAGQAVLKAAKSGPEARSQLLVLARESAGRQDYQRVRMLLEGWEQFGKDSPEWNNLAGYAEYKLGNPRLAESRLRRAIELAPAVEQYWMNIGEMFLFFDSASAAEAFFESGIHRLPESAMLHFGLAVSYLAGDAHLDEIIPHLETALQINPRFDPAFPVMCRVYHERQDWQALAQTLVRWEALSGKSPRLLYYKALLISDSDTGAARNDAEARKLLEESIQLSPGDADVRLAMGKILLRSGHLPDGIRELEHAARIDPRNPSIHYQLAMAYRLAGEKQKGEEQIGAFQRLKSRKQDWKFMAR